MNRATRAYIATVIVLGFLNLWTAYNGLVEFHFVRFICIASLIAVSSTLKVPLPGVNGTLSIGFIFKLLAIASLDFFPALVAAGIGVIAQSFWKAENAPRLYQIGFNLSSVFIALSVASHGYALVLSWQPELHTGALIIAGGLYFVTNTWAVSGVIALIDSVSILRVWKECYFWSFPYYLVGGGVAGLMLLCMKTEGWLTALFIAPMIYLIHRSYMLYMTRMEQGKQHAEELAALHLRTIQALAMAIEAKDQTTHDHLQRVRVYASEIAKEIRLPEAERHALAAASLLHDIGKLAVPEHIICKPGKLNEEEFARMKIHPVVGAEILERVKFPYPVVPIVRSHHEKWDGSGYPDGLKGEEIPVGARILAVVDCLDALASDRQYRPAFPLEKALEIVVSQSGTAFDPRIVEIVERRCIELEQMAKIESAKSNKQIDTDIHVERGEKPAAGFERSEGSLTDSRSSAISYIASARLEAGVLLQLTRDLASSLGMNEVLATLPSSIERLIEFDCVAIYLDRSRVLTPVHVSGLARQVFAGLKIPVGEGLSGWVAENNRPILNGNPDVELGYQTLSRATTGMQSALAVPLEGAAGVTGVLALYSSHPDSFSKDDLRIAKLVSSRVGLAVDNALKYQAAYESATEDHLTGLPNARSTFLNLDNELSRAKRMNTTFALFVCDLDEFKKINDSLGHLEGNHTLKRVAVAIRENSREYDFAGRMGGDEFVVILPGVEPAVAAARIDSLEAGVRASARVGISIGAAFYPADGQDAEALLVVADKRMYERKNASRNSPSLFVVDPNLQATVH